MESKKKPNAAPLSELNELRSRANLMAILTSNKKKLHRFRLGWKRVAEWRNFFKYW